MHNGGDLGRVSVVVGCVRTSDITLLVLTRIGPGFSAKEMSGWRVVSWTLTWESESVFAAPLALVSMVSIAIVWSWKDITECHWWKSCLSPAITAPSDL